MLSAEKEALLQQFHAYLEQEDVSELSSTNESMDLYTLFGELSALTNEVRIESRQVKGALDQFRGLVEPLQVGQAALQRESQRLREDRRQQERDLLQPLLLELLELRDRMASGLEIPLDHHTGFRLFGRFCHHEQEMLDLWRQGQEMSLKRLDQTLAKRDVLPIDVVGQVLNPRVARAVRAEQHQQMADGVVVSELRKGFMWQNELLRVAEVVVNKTVE